MEFWTRMKLKLEALHTVKSRNFLKFVLKREKTLLSNDAVIASIYMDPRYKNTLSVDEVLCSQSLHKIPLVH
jgi:hypothetical protein